MCVNCKNISCSGCGGTPSVPNNTSDITFDGDKLVCNGLVFNTNQALNQTIANIAKGLCDRLQDPGPQSFGILWPPDNWDNVESGPFIGQWFVIEQFTFGVPRSVEVQSTTDPNWQGGYMVIPFTLDRDNCSEDITATFINLPSGFTNGGGDGIMSYPFSTWEFLTDILTLEYDGTTVAGVYEVDLELSTANCGTVIIPYLVVVNP